MKKVIIEKWQAEDGTIHDTAYACRLYEQTKKAQEYLKSQEPKKPKEKPKPNIINCDSCNSTGRRLNQDGRAWETCYSCSGKGYKVRKIIYE